MWSMLKTMLEDVLARSSFACTHGSMLKRAIPDGRFVAPRILGPSLMLRDSEASHGER
jgi:hypothetical protein